MDWGKLWFRIFPTTARSFRTTAKDLRRVVASQRLAGVRHSRAGRRLKAPARHRHPARRAAPGRQVRRVRARRRGVSVSTAVCLTMAVVAGLRRRPRPTGATRSSTQIAETQSDLSESHRALRRAARRRSTGRRVGLDVAQAALAQTRRELAAAAARDRPMAAKLDAGPGPSSPRPRPRSATVSAELDAQKRKAGGSSATSTSSRPTCCRSPPCCRSGTTADLQTRLQWSTTMFDTTAGRDRPADALQSELEMRQGRQAALERQVAADRGRRPPT